MPKRLKQGPSARPDGLGGGRRSIEVSEFSCLQGNEGYGDCDDAVQGYFDNYTT